MKETAKRLLSSLGYYRVIRKVRAGTALAIFMYHDLAADEECHSDGSAVRERVSRAQLEAHLKAMRTHCRVMSVEQAVREIKTEGCLLEDTASITFDDGYRSVFDIAYPLLLEYRLPATIYLTTGWVNGETYPWWETVSDMIVDCDLQSVPLVAVESMLDVSIETHLSNECDMTAKKLLLSQILTSRLRELDHSEVEKRTDELRTVFGQDVSHCAPAEPLTWDQIKIMAGNDIRFGSHTVSHLNLSRAPLGAIEREVAESKRNIENQLDSEVEGFAYPYGQDIAAYRRAEPVLKAAGFSYACTASPGVNRGDSDLYSLLRETLPLTDSASLLGREIMLDLAAVRST